MTHEVSTIAYEGGDVVGIAQEVLASGRWTPPITASVKH
jgi:hypothetical protein